MKLPLLALWAVPLCVVISSCHTYTSLPFDPKVMLAELNELRNKRPEGKVLTFDAAATLMDAGNLELKELQASYTALKVVADLPTPFPNPEIEAGPVTRHDSTHPRRQ